LAEVDRRAAISAFVCVASAHLTPSVRRGKKRAKHQEGVTDWLFVRCDRAS
jgi:hypothetical protein